MDQAEVAIALRNGVYESLPEEVRLFLDLSNRLVHTDKAGRLYYFNNVDWYGAAEMQKLSRFLLQSVGADDYLFLVNWERKPNSCYELGEWTYNPWQVRRVVKSFISFKV